MSDIVASMLSEVGQHLSADGLVSQDAGADTAAKSNDTEFLERFNRLATKEAAIRKRDQEMRAERESMKAKLERLERFEKLGKEDPDALLGEFGLDYDKLTERRLSGLGGESSREFQQLKEELHSLKTSLQTKEAEQSERLKKEAEGEALQRANAEIRQLCESEEFELINSFESHDLVLDTAAEYFQATGKMISLAEAAKHVEAHLEKKLERILAAKKVAARQQKSETAPQDSLADLMKGGSRPRESKTLSSSMAGESRPSLAQSEEDLRQATLRMLRGV